jgi:hypothetical protein
VPFNIFCCRAARAVVVEQAVVQEHVNLNGAHARFFCAIALARAASPRARFFLHGALLGGRAAASRRLSQDYRDRVGWAPEATGGDHRSDRERCGP